MVNGVDTFLDGVKFGTLVSLKRFYYNPNQPQRVSSVPQTI